MRRAGFTLLEVLIALAITAGIMTAVSMTLDGVRKAVDAIHNIVESENTGPRVLDLIREDLSRIAVYDAANYTLLQGENEILYGADADRLDFVVYSPSKVPVRLPGQDDPTKVALNEVGYRLRENPVRKDFLELYRREDPLIDDRPREGGSYTLLYDRVVNFDIGYATTPELSPVWHDNWDSTREEALPHAIRISLTMEVQPRRSYESLGIMGANLSRLDFEDFLVIPAETRWRFRHRIHPQRPAGPGEEGAEGGEGPSPGEGGAGEGAGSVPAELPGAGGGGGGGPRGG